jgi:long-chain acyl-CoA synthetase
MNLGKFLDDCVEKFGDLPYVTFYDRAVTYNDLDRRVNTLANSLKRLGFGHGDFIHVWVQNSPETLVSYLAIQKIGAVPGPINGWWKAAEVEYLLNDSQGTGLIVEDQYLPQLKEIRDKCPHLKHVIEVGEQPAEGHISFTDLLARGDDSPVTCTADPEDTAYIFYTSGTTGNPKGVLLSHKNVLADIEGVTQVLGIGQGENFLCFLPLFHVNAMLTCMASLAVGSHIVLRQAFSAGEFWEVVEKYRINYWSAVPAVYQILLSDQSRSKFDLSSLKFAVCGAAPLREETMRSFEDIFKIPILEGYGLTEATCVSTLNPREGVRKVGSIGLPLPGQEVLIVDDDGREVGPNARGEIAIRGDVVMKGYYNRPEETAETIVNGMLLTGDVGIKDDDGYIFIVDRKKDMIIRGGENIYPKEIDVLLAEHPKIQEAATVGKPDKTMGEEVVAYVVALDDSLTEEEVIDYCQENLAAFKVPKEIEILEDDFPRNAVGKVLKKTLREWAKGNRPESSKPKSGASVEHIFGTMTERAKPEGVQGVNAVYGYIITGDGGGEWTVTVADGAVTVKEGIHDPEVTTTITAKDWIALNLGKLDAMTAFTSGKILATGNLLLLQKVPRFFKPYQPPPAAPEVTVADIFGTMESRVKPEGVQGVTANYGYVVTGSGGGEWTVAVTDGTVKVSEGLHSPNVTTKVAAKDWIAITLGKLDGMTAFTSGKLKVEGELSLLMKAPHFFKPYRPPQARPQVTVADIFGTMEQRVNPEGIKGVDANYGYVITGSGGGEWTVKVHDDAVKVVEGLDSPDVKTTVAAKDWIAITLGKLDGMTAFTSGKLKVEGNLGLLTKATQFFKKYSPPTGEVEEPREELIVLKQVLSIPQRFSSGPVMGKFLKGLKAKKIVANKCPKCGRLQLPAREVCAECVVPATEWQEVGPEGSIAVFDITYYASPDPLTGESRDTPYISAHFLLDGCKGHETLWHELKTDDITRVKKGDRVRPVWRENRTGAITDIKYFEIIEQAKEG